jgi:SNF2 family DNA or RNA helicase
LITATLSEGDVVVRGTGTALLRAKTALVSALGEATIRSRGGGELFFSVSFCGACLEALGGFQVDQALADVIQDWRCHAAAVVRAHAQLKAGEVVAPSDWAARLDDHQAIALGVLVEPGLKGVCLFDEQGTGKTVMGLAAFDVLARRGDVEQLVVLCPKSMVAGWQQEAQRFLGSAYPIADVSDSGYEQLNWTKSRIAVGNFDVLSRAGVKLGGFARARRTLLIVDESYYVKSDEAERTRLAFALRSACVRAFVLCGTPAPNAAVDLLSQFDLADGGFTFGPVRPVSEEAIRSRIASRGVVIRRLKSDVMPELAPKVFVPHRVSLSARQAWWYSRASNGQWIETRGLDARVTRWPLRSPFQRRAWQFQICNWPSAVDPTCVSNSKLEELDRILHEMVSTRGEKVVVWSHLSKPIAEMVRRYSAFHPVSITGDTSVADRADAVNRFQNDPDVKLFIGNPAAAGAGITLTAASQAVYYSLSNRAADVMQSLDRIHRRGQRAKSVEVHVLIAENTIEELAWEQISRHAKGQAQVLGDDEPALSGFGPAEERPEDDGA